MAFKYINPGYAELLNGTTVTTVRDSFHNSASGVSFTAEEERITVIPAGKITNAVFCKFDIFSDYIDTYNYFFIGLSGGVYIEFSRGGSCSLIPRLNYQESGIFEGEVNSIYLRIQANDSSTGTCEMTITNAAQQTQTTSKTIFSLDEYPIANRSFFVDFSSSDYGTLFYISNLIISDEEISEKEYTVALPINLTSTDMTADGNGLYTATSADQILLQTPNAASLISQDINLQVKGVMVAGNPAYKTTAQSTSLISLSKGNNVITEHNSCELSDDANAKIADGWRVDDVTITDFADMQFGWKTNGGAVIKPEQFIFASIAPPPEISLCIRHDGGIVSCPFKFSQTPIIPGLAVRHEDKNWYNELVAPNAQRAGHAHLRLGSSEYALSDTKFSGSYTPAGVSKLWFPFMEAVTYDVFGNGIERYRGSPTIENDKLKLDGYSYIVSKIVGIGGQSFTIDCWAQWENSLSNYCGQLFNCPNFIRIERCHKNNNQILVQFDDFENCNGVCCCFAVPEPLTTRFHIAVVYQHTEELLKIYFNGSCVFKWKWKFESRFYDHALTIGGQPPFSSGNWEGTIEHFRYIDGLALWTEEFTPPDKLAEYIVQMGVTPAWDNMEYGVRFDGDTWVYSNEGTADLLCVGGRTLTNLPETQSRTGTAFYQTNDWKCFPIPKTKEIWAKFDVYCNGETVWTAANRVDVWTNYGWGNHRFGIFALPTWEYENDDIRNWVTIYLFVIKGKIFPVATRQNTLQTFLLHMVSGSSAGVMEVWADGESAYRYEGDVNHGEIFEDFYLQSTGAGAFFSNVTISNVEISLNEN